TSAMLQSAFGQQGARAAENRKIEEKPPSQCSDQKSRRKIKSVEIMLSTGTAATQEALTYSRAVRAPTGPGTVGMGHTDATDPGTKAPVMGTTSAEEENPALQGMPFAKAEDEVILPGQGAESDAAADKPEIVLPGQTKKSEAAAADEAGQAKDAEKTGTDKTGDAEKAPADDPSIKNEISQLKQREQEVIAHEAAHKAVGGQYASAATYTYTTGPDGQRYIDGGEVSIRTPSTNDPEEALRMAELVKRAALAPANPSSQDLSVAAGVTQKATTARAEISKLAREEAAEKRTAAQAEKSEKAEETRFGKTGATSSGSKDDKKSSGIDLSGAAAARGQKAADAYASLSTIHQNSGSSGKLHAIG
ncbi:MAG: hypothetical protein GX776_09940, partial [Oxalobacter sp.]|nr:hypothetical protein [Oxalobacter sp.]